MAKYMFKNDYSEGAHPSILQLLQETNMEQLEGYGLDTYSLEAADIIRKLTGFPNADVHFLSGGTQTNLTLIAAALRPHQSVIAPVSAHINIHEAGAIEATGHKIFQVSSADGKIRPEQIEQAVKFHEDEHFVKPKLVFISNATELGTVYSKAELEAIYKTCVRLGLYLYIDGARLGSAIAASDLDFKTLAANSDAFYIGGTKNGALLGEALVITNPVIKEDFRYMMKQRGALLAKGRVVGLQFLGLLRDGLYLDLAQEANTKAQRLARAFADLGFDFLTQPQTNQIFPVVPKILVEKLWEKYDFYVWQELNNGKVVIRLVTSWATPDDEINNFINYLNQSVEML